MTDHRHPGPGGKAGPVPRDMPDQQAREGRDPWDPRSARGGGTAEAEDAADVPDTDEAGTGRQGTPRSGAVHPEHPVPDEAPG